MTQRFIQQDLLARKPQVLFDERQQERLHIVAGLGYGRRRWQHRARQARYSQPARDAQEEGQRQTDAAPVQGDFRR
ncbi:hypothetical protein D3C80_2118520 [compost metagenome]